MPLVDPAGARRHGDQAILWPARPDNPATIVALLGAASVLHHAGHRDVLIRWVRIDDGRLPEYRPELLVPGVRPMQALAKAIARTPAPDPSVYPAGTSQTCGSAITAYLAEHPNERHLSNAIIVLKRELRERGHDREARLIGGSVGVVPAREWPARLRRSPITRGAKSDIRAATEGWRNKRPLTPDHVEQHLRREAWDYTLHSGDWGLDSNHWGEARRVANPRFGNPVLARLLTEGVMAMDGSWNPHDRWSYNQAAYPPRLGWPIWDYDMPWQALTHWLAWPLDPFGDVDHPPPTDAESAGVASWGIVEWWVAEAIPINRMISTYRHATVVSHHRIRQAMYYGVDPIGTPMIPESTEAYSPGQID